MAERYEKIDLTLESIAEDSETVKRFKAERLKRKDDADVAFNLVVVFQSEEQRSEFLAQLEGVPVLFESFVDGQTFAEHVGLPVTRNEVPPKKNSFNRKLAAMVDQDKLQSYGD